MGEQFEEKIQRALEHGTENSVELKGQVWKQIQARIQPNVSNMSRMERKRREKVKNMGRMRRIIGIGTVAAALMVTFFLGTQPGKAAISKIRELFEPEKKITQELEGTKEEIDVTLQESNMGYIIYVDEEYYQVEKYDGRDRIVPKTKGEGFPEVFMEISQVEDKNPEAMAQQILDELKAKFSNVENRGSVDQPISAIMLSAIEGNNSDDTVVRYYLVDNTKGGTFVIKQQYFREAAEGHGARFYHMLKEFKIVELEE